MARVGRLAGAIVADSRGACYLVGHPKQPCDWRAAGFEPPGEIDARARPAIPLVRCGAVVLAAPVLELELEGEALARLLVDCFVIPRTGSVSERLWRLVIGEPNDPADDPTDAATGEPGAPPTVIPARWLGELPPAIWRIVRDTVLRCT
jgi:hypothetical protein